MKNNYLIAITEDLFDIADRLRSVNASYKVYYNSAKNRYEVHSDEKHGDKDTLAFVVPYDGLDARTIEYAQKTSVANIKMLLEEIEQSNRQREKDAERDTVNKIFAEV